jgi:small GTP-binding protein
MVCPADGRLSPQAVLLGDADVGKTSLPMRWVTGAYSPSVQSTINAINHPKRLVVEEREVELVVWDTAGQEQFHALAPLYARYSSVAILIASIVDSASFDHLERWISVLNLANQDFLPVVLAVVEIDLSDSAKTSSLSTDRSRRCVFRRIRF